MTHLNQFQDTLPSFIMLECIVFEIQGFPYATPPSPESAIPVQFSVLHTQLVNIAVL